MSDTASWRPSALQRRWSALPDWARGALGKHINPANETRIHLARHVARGGAEIGAHTYGRPRLRFPESGGRLAIGRFGSIADGVELLLGGNHRTDWVTTYPFPAFAAAWPGAAGRSDFHTGGDITIGHDVWLGSQCMILPGVTIGHGAVVAARAVVTRDVPPYGIVGGSPAKLIRMRFDDATVARLLKAAWWDWPEGAIAAALPRLMSGDVEAFLDACPR